jgi:uncharacterized protein YecT (DUF1311 family)
MPRVHLETAIGQFDGTIALVSNQIDAALEAAPQCAARLAQVRPAALEALTGHRAWLSARLAEADGTAASPTRGSGRSGSPASCRSR